MTDEMLVNIGGIILIVVFIVWIAFTFWMTKQEMKSETHRIASENRRWWRCEICGKRIDFPKDWMDDKKIQAIIDHDCIKGEGDG